MIDTELRESIERALAREAFDAQTIQVQVDAGRVRLTGEVRCCAIRDEAVAIARRIAGPQNVRCDLRVRAPEVPDAELAARIRSLLDWNAMLDRDTVQVDVSGGTVTLRGCLPGRVRHQRLLAQVGALAGVDAVIDAIEAVDPVGGLPLAARIRASIRCHAPTDSDRIRFDVADDGSVRLEGELSDWHSRQAVVEAVRALAGVQRVEDAITVDD